MSTQTKLSKVLLVDDNPIDLMIHERLVLRHDQQLNVLKAKSAQEALELLKKETVDLILLDIKMPGMDGFEFLAALRQSDYPAGRSLTYMVSSSIDPKDIESAKNDDWVKDFLEKPLNADKLDQIFQ